jgi:hypothetical protein
LIPGGGAVVAHGVGNRQDLPLPFGLAVTGAGLALVVTFVLLGLLWPEPRLNGAASGRPLPGRLAALLDSPTTRRALAGLGAVLSGYAAIGLVLGRDDARNPTPFVVYVLFWVGLVPVSALLGPVWRWLELIAPGNTTLPVLRLAITGFVAVQLMAGFVFGSRWFDKGDPFEVWSALYGLISPLGRRGDGVLVLRSPLAGLDALRSAPGLTATVSVMLGGTAYDGASNAPAWFTFVQSRPWPQHFTETFGLFAVIGLVWGLFVGCLALCGWLTGTASGPLAGQFAPSLVPIAFGYVVAHYWSLLILEGQNSAIRLTDPLGTGADWLGLADRAPDVTLLEPTLVAVVQVVAVLVGHVLGVVLAHDRAVRLFPHKQALIGQLPLLILMVVYTCGGLLVLFSA